MDKLVATLSIIATATLTAISTVVFVMVGAIAVTAFVMAIRLKRVVDELESAVQAQADKIAEVTRLNEG